MWVARTVAKGRGRHVFGRPEHTAETPSRLRQPTTGAVLTAAHGDEPGSAVHPMRVPSRPAPSPTGLAMRTRYPAQHTRPLRDRTPTPAPRRRRRTRAGADHAANTVALLCATRRESTPRGVHRLPGGVQAPGAVGPRRRQGRVPPPPPQAHFVEHLSCPRKTAGDLSTPGATRGSDRNRSARIWCGPPLVPQPHACPHGTQPRRQPKDPMRLASRGPAIARTAGISAAPAIRGSRAAGPVKGGF
jgi:hypothetical protein